MTTLATTRPPAARSLIRFLRSPKGLLLIVLGLLAAFGAAVTNQPHFVANVASALLVAALTDVCLALWVRDEWVFPSGALLTGLIVALILSPAEPPSVLALTSAIAVGSKYLFRTSRSNVFNPAAFALVVSYFVFGTAQSWWGALPDLPTVAVVIVLAGGIFIADRVNKLPMALVFLAAFYGLFTVTSFVGDPARVLEVFRAPDANAALFLALFMLDDPPTSSVRYGDQVVFGLIAALASYAVYMTIGAVYYLPAGILVANVWEAIRRVREHGARARR